MMKGIEGLTGSRGFNFAFWAGLSFMISFVLHRKILLPLWQPESRLESMGEFFFLYLLVLVLLLSAIRSKLSVLSDFLKPLRDLAGEHPVLFKAVLIGIPVILFNLVNVFGPHYLLNDDPARYREGISSMVNWSAWFESYKISTFTEGFAGWSMAHYSPFVVRLLYLLLYLTGISLCTYWISRRIFNLGSSCAYLAAVLPAVFPPQVQVIAGINLSYTLPGQLIALLALICGFCYLARDRHSWSLAVLAGMLFVVSTRMMEQAMFLSAAIGFIYLVTSRHFLRKIVLLLPVAASSAVVLYTMIANPRIAATPHDIPAGIILQRIKMFLEYLSPIRAEYSFLLTLLLFIVGLVSFRFWPEIKDRASDLPHFTWLPKDIRYWILPVFASAWTFFSAFPFIALNARMTARNIHLAGFGPWLIIAPGLAFLLSSVFFFLRKPVRKRLFVFVVFIVIAIAGFEHTIYSIQRYAAANHHLGILSRSISRQAFPLNSQIVITDAYMGSYSSYHIATGYLCRLLNSRLDVGGLVGPEYFYYDPFCRENLWQTRMTGLRGMENLHLFRLHQDGQKEPGGGLRPYRHFLRVITCESQMQEGEKPGDWRLYEFDSQGKAVTRNTGHGIDQYTQLLVELKAEGIEPGQICWGNPGDQPGGNSPLND